MLTHKRLAVSFVLVIICGCASTPPAAVSYYLPKATVSVTATQKLSCNRAKTQAFVATTVDFSTKYSANYSIQAVTFEPHSLDSAFSDSEIEISFYDDGRLKSINTSNDGTGNAVVKSVATFAPLLLGGGAGDKKTGLPICKTISEFAGDAPATITYKKVLDFTGSTVTSELTLTPSAESVALYNSINPPLPMMVVEVASPKEIAPPVAGVRQSDRNTLLRLPKMATVDITVRAPGEILGAQETLIPNGGTYGVPVPKAKAFGSTKFNVAIAESGLITALGYTKKDGSAAAISSSNDLYSSLVPSDTVRAQQLGAEVDLIVQRNRHATCIADPANCK